MKKIKKKWNGILYKGKYDNFSVDSGITNNNSIQIERQRRIEMAYVLATYPETFEVLFENNINLFHGTNINALPNILKYGMNSLQELSNKGIAVSTGEQSSRIGPKRNFISFTDNLDTGFRYASTQYSEEEQRESSFGMLIGMSSNTVTQMQTCKVDSDTTEVGILDNIPLEYIKVIAVPEDKIKFVRKLVNNDKIIVTPIDMNEKFYYIDESTIEFDSEKAKELIEGKKQSQSQTTFNNEDVKKLSESRRKSRILDIYRKIKEKISNRGIKRDETNSRDK